MSGFQYSPLSPERNEIRLLRPIQSKASRYLPQPQDDTRVVPDLSLSFELLTVSLDDKPSYTTLSYVWGKMRVMKAITVNGSPFEIGLSLESAFRNMQYKDIAPAIWVDAVCINQNDNAEKADQVPRMRDIYAGARQVVIWLGPGTDGTGLTADVLGAFSRIAKKRNARGVPDPPPRRPLIAYLDLDDGKGLLEILNEVVEDLSKANARTKFSAWNELLSAILSVVAGIEWWHRVWVIQEFLVSPTYFLQAGARKLGTDELAAMLVTITALQVASIETRMDFDLGIPGMRTFSFFMQWVLELQSYREQYLRNGLRSLGLYDILCVAFCKTAATTHQILSASDARDKIYGFIGLVEEDWKRLRLTVSYDWSTQDVFVHVATRFLISGNMDILGLCQRWPKGNASGPSTPRNDNDLSNLPSWVPDWTASIMAPHTWWKNSHPDHETLGNWLFSASASSVADLSFKEPKSEDRDWSNTIHSMVIQGIFVDEILEVKDKSYKPALSDSPDNTGTMLTRILLEDVRSLCETCAAQQAQRPGAKIYTPTQLHEAAWRIPIWDHESIDGIEQVQRATSLSELGYRKCVEALSTLDHQQKQQHRWFQTYTDKENNNGHELAAIQASGSADANKYFINVLGGAPKRPFVTKQGFVGIGPVTTLPGDVVGIILGARAPHILRRRCNQEPGYTLLGQAYVHGIMDGEFMGEAGETQSFELF
ncbi:heterokaryon incompatibility protein-domain-containing protein [Clohesyomyces aquaticus]|uniref:Heterokaryon incompatibility protein-domain-containing protein n=1 Tax=Clohesyomyces aquaticus TaxID=1231657 RepID=A0A1Y1ZUP5_9PLEO|nr:heterokaryon incompatibility protein-domain-containing protein [Clohesyomyces aquaticus]